MKNLLLSFLFTFLVFIPLNANKVEVVTENYPPYQWMEKDTITGPSTEVIQALIEKVGIDHTLKIYPWARSYYLALNYENVLIYTLRRLKQREKLFKWVGVIGKNNVYFWKLKKRKDIKIDTFEDAKKYKISTINKDAKSLFLLNQGFIKDKNLVVLNEKERLIMLFYAKRTDLIIDSESLIPYVTKLGYDPKQLEKIYLIDKYPINLYAAFSLMTEDFIVDKFRKALEELKRDGEFDRINAKYK